MGEKPKKLSKRQNIVSQDHRVIESLYIPNCLSYGLDLIKKKPTHVVILITGGYSAQIIPSWTIIIVASNRISTKKKVLEGKRY